MAVNPLLTDVDRFSKAVYERMLFVSPGLVEVALYEFRYALDRLMPSGWWASVETAGQETLLARIHERAFFAQVQVKPMYLGQIAVDQTILRLTQTLLAGLVNDAYPPDWIRQHFYFDVRAFLFFVRTEYFSEAIRDHLGGHPLVQLEPGQARFECAQDIGYREFQEANAGIDRAFVNAIHRLMTARGTPFLLTLVGPSAAGKTEIVERLRSEFSQEGKQVTSIEIDHFLKDREFRDGRPMGPEVMHFELFKQSLAQLRSGRQVCIPRYDFLRGTSSHDLDGRLRPGQEPLQIDPADVIFLEGNFPFHHPEILPLVGISAVYLTDDPIRLKRKWKRDIDYRKKYDPAYFVNRYFRTQELRAGELYRPAMEVCDLVVDTTAAALWATPQIALELGPVQDFLGSSKR